MVERRHGPFGRIGKVPEAIATRRPISMANSRPNRGRRYGVWKVLAESPGPGLPTQVRKIIGSAADSPDPFLRPPLSAAARSPLLCPGPRNCCARGHSLSRWQRRWEACEKSAPLEMTVGRTFYRQNPLHLLCLVPFSCLHRWPLLDLNLLAKVKELGEWFKSDLVRAAGYVSQKKDGQVSA